MARDAGAIRHAAFRELTRFLRPRSLLVLNDTRVIPARLRGRKPSGGAVETLLVRSLPAQAGEVGRGPAAPWQEDWEVLGRGLAGLPQGTKLDFGPTLRAEVRAHGERGAATVRFEGCGSADMLAAAEQVGAVPLPPYIEAARRRAGEPPSAPEDKGRYQTVYARAPGAVAAPTAGLHFTERLLDEVRAAGHETVHITLHVGPGTFRPVGQTDPARHHIDPEPYEIAPEAATAVEAARAHGRPIVAVGTTVVRALETAAAAGAVVAGAGQTRLFIYPGFRPAPELRVVTDLVTNFHLPRSSLLMLVSAFAGRERVLAAYAEAVRGAYRFYSYGDAMFIRPGELPA